MLRLQLVFLYAIASAAVGTQSVVMAKCTSQILRLQIGGESQLGSPFSVYILLVFAGSASFWMMRLNRGLRLFPSTFIVPMMQGIPTPPSPLFLGRFSPVLRRFSAVLLCCLASWRHDGENGRKMAEKRRNLGEKRARNSGG